MKENRKAFNFYKSHWEQIAEIDSEEEQLKLFKAICQVQFFIKDIKDIKFEDKITNLVWIGFKHSIETSKNGFETKNKSIIEKKKILEKDFDSEVFNKISAFYNKNNNRETGSIEKAKINFIKTNEDMSSKDIMKAVSNYTKECLNNKTFMKHLCNILDKDFLIPYVSKEVKGANSKKEFLL